MVTFTQEQIQAFEARRSARNPIASEPVPADSVDDESELHSAIIGDCNRRGWVFFHSRMNAKTRRKKGEPDFEIFADGGRFFLIECKSKTGEPSPEQVSIMSRLKALGHDVKLVRSYQQYLEIIR